MAGRVRPAPFLFLFLAGTQGTVGVGEVEVDVVGTSRRLGTPPTLSSPVPSDDTPGGVSNLMVYTRTHPPVVRFRVADGVFGW